jgi:hypothetical protein
MSQTYPFALPESMRRRYDPFGEPTEPDETLGLECLAWWEINACGLLAVLRQTLQELPLGHGAGGAYAYEDPGVRHVFNALDSLTADFAALYNFAMKSRPHDLSLRERVAEALCHQHDVQPRGLRVAS